MKKKNSNTKRKPAPEKQKVNFQVNPLFAAIIGALMPVQGRNGVKS